MMQRMGVEIKRNDGRYFLNWKTRKPTDIFLDEPSVTATEMGLMMASTMPTTMKIDDAATEPHVADLVSFLTKMGANISGAGSNVLSITGAN